MSTEEFWMSAELVRLRSERRVMVELMSQLLSVALAVDTEGDDEEAAMQVLIQRTRNALAAVLQDATPEILPGWPILKITGYQLREALEFLAPDGAAEQLGASACIQRGPERVHDEGTDPAGLYCWLDDCPQEGSIPLTGDDARIHLETKQPAQPSVAMPEEPPAAALGVLIGHDSLEHLNDCDQEVLRNRARMRWTALREACRSTLAEDPA